MARLIVTDIKNCTVKGCGTRTKFQRWSCGCVDMEVFDDGHPCPECSGHADLQQRCGQLGNAESHGEK